MLLDKVASIQRLIQSQSDADKESYGAVSGLEAISVNVQPSNAETTAIAGGIFGKTYTIYCTVSGIKDGDRITVSGTFVDGISQNKQLQVANVGGWSFPPLPHFEITCMEIEQ